MNMKSHTFLTKNHLCALLENFTLMNLHYVLVYGLYLAAQNNQMRLFGSEKLPVIP